MAKGKSKEPTWDEIGKIIGKKIGKEFKKGECGPWYKWKEKKVVKSCSGGGIYFFGFIGAVIYYIQLATGFWDGVLGVLKALVWPAFLVYGLLKYIGL
jgi:hypothetical protein